MEIISTSLNGLKIIQSGIVADTRGNFRKVFNESFFKENELRIDFKEFYYSTSHKNVIRGLHFQIPPHDHVKLVFVTQGEILDVVLDIRKNSLTYGHVFSTILNDSNEQALYIPKGFAHGFLSLKNDTIVNYMQTSVYNKDSDTGILYKSIDFGWNNVQSPIVSERDQSFISFKQFKSPF